MCTFAMLIWVIFHPAGERTFLVPSTAMAPTLVIGDIVVMARYGPGERPERGDVIAFSDPRDPLTVQMFRVIGLADDSVRLENGTVMLNGLPLPRQAEGEYVIDLGYDLQPATVWRETLPDGGRYDTLDSEDGSFLDTTGEFRVPPGHVFVLGDNRDNAADSRMIERIGYVPEAAILGPLDRILASCPPDGGFLAERTGLPLGP